MTRTIRMKDIAGLKANATTAPFVTTEPTKIGGVRGVVDPPPSSQGLIFSESFDSWPEFTSSSGLPVDVAWDYRRDGEQQFTGAGFHDSFEITDSIADAIRSGSKAFVGWRESFYEEPSASNNWNSDGILVKVLETGRDEVFVRFYIKFPVGFTHGGTSKLFRISSWAGTGNGDVFAFGNKTTDTHGPTVFWDYSYGATYGLRNFIALRASPRESNYFMGNPRPDNLPREMISGDMSLNFGPNVSDYDGDGIAEQQAYPSLIDGLPVADVTSHDDVYGSGWNKIEFYVKMNSTPGIKDGHLKQWINNHLTFSNETVAWMGNGSDPALKWNFISLGGNDRFSSYPNADQHEEWYAIDDFEIYDTLPEGYN